MQRSTDRIIVSHAGSLVRPPAVRDLLVAKAAGQPYDEARYVSVVRDAVVDGVRHQVECGIDVVTDGELSKLSFTNYARERLGGIEERPTDPNAPIARTYGRDLELFPEYFTGRGNVAGREAVCVGPLAYKGHEAVQFDIANLKAALGGVDALEAFLPAVAPGTIEHWLKNDYYKSDEEYLFAIADAMHEEYKAIVDAGFVLQIDDPDLADGWQVYSDRDELQGRDPRTVRQDRRVDGPYLRKHPAGSHFPLDCQDRRRNPGRRRVGVEGGIRPFRAGADRPVLATGRHH